MGFDSNAVQRMKPSPLISSRTLKKSETPRSLVASPVWHASPWSADEVGDVSIGAVEAEEPNRAGVESKQDDLKNAVVSTYLFTLF